MPCATQGQATRRARKAAEVLANYDDRVNRSERQLDGLDRKIDQAVFVLERKIDAGRAGQNLLRWMSGTSVALSLAILLKLFIH